MNGMMNLRPIFVPEITRFTSNLHLSELRAGKFTLNTIHLLERYLSLLRPTKHAGVLQWYSGAYLSDLEVMSWQPMRLAETVFSPRRVEWSFIFLILIGHTAIEVHQWEGGEEIVISRAEGVSERADRSSGVRRLQQGPGVSAAVSLTGFGD
jgi:hypothetical protein